MRFITTNSITPQDIKKDSIKAYSSITDVMKDESSSEKLYILEIKEEDSFLKRFMFKLSKNRQKGNFKNHYLDANKRVIKLVRKITLTEMKANGATPQFFYRYAISNRDRLKSNSIDYIVDFLIENEMDTGLMIALCVRLSKHKMPKVQDYILSRINNIDMIIEFANKVDNCDINKIVEHILDNYSIQDLIKFVNNVNKCDATHIVKTISKTNSFNVVLNTIAGINNTNLDFNEIEDMVINLDDKGKKIYRFTEKFNDRVNITKMTRAIIAKDSQGFDCLNFMNKIKGVDKELLAKAVVEKDKVGAFCIEILSIPGINANYLTDKILNIKNLNPRILVLFAKRLDKEKIENKEVYLDKLLKKLMDMDTTKDNTADFLAGVSNISTILRENALNTLKF